MKKALLIICISFGALAACNSSENKGSGLEVATDTTAVRYQCPMKCQGDTAYTTAGKCPVCNMDLKEMEHTHDHGE